MACKGLFYTIAVDIYTFRLVFCRISHCVLHHFTLRLASKRTAFCTKLHCILRQNAANLANNGPKAGANCGFMQCVFILPAFTTNPFLHQNKPSRESIFCGWGGRLVDFKGTHNVKILAENCTKLLAWHSRVWATARKARTFTAASKSGCRACRSQPTETASWKCRNQLPLRRQVFNCRINTWKYFQQATF